MSAKRSKVHAKYKTKYRVTNWAAYDRSLVARGDITLWITPEALEAWRPAPSGCRGAQPKFSDVAIETALTLRIMFHLPLRQTEGFLRSVLRIMGLDLQAPDHTTLSRRGQCPALDLRAVPRQGPIHLLIDSSGFPQATGSRQPTQPDHRTGESDRTKSVEEGSRIHQQARA